MLGRSYETQLRNKRRVEPIRRSGRPKKTWENAPLYRLTEVKVDSGTIKVLNGLLKAAVMTATNNREENPLGTFDDLLWRLMVWPTSSDCIKSFSILVPFRHEQSASIIMNCSMSNGEQGLEKESKAVILFLFSNRRSLGLGLLREGKRLDNEIAVGIVRDLETLIRNEEVHIGLQVKSLVKDGKSTWIPIKKAYSTCSSLRDWVSAVCRARPEEKRH